MFCFRIELRNETQVKTCIFNLIYYCEYNQLIGNNENLEFKPVIEENKKLF